MLNDVQNELDSAVRKLAESNLIKKLNEQSLTRSDIPIEKFNELLSKEIEIVKSDGKKVGAGIGIGIALSLITGGLF